MIYTRGPKKSVASLMGRVQVIGTLWPEMGGRINHRFISQSSHSLSMLKITNFAFGRLYGSGGLGCGGPYIRGRKGGSGKISW